MTKFVYESHDYLCYTKYEDAKAHVNCVGGIPQQMYLPHRKEADENGNVWVIAEKEILPGDSNILCLRENGFWL